ncbi:MAG: hypothetical protein KIC90_00505 [Firmicutes bacterium]|jgi:hypothetical protein|nr:hypothetical protein [Bacillota bacterium]
MQNKKQIILSIIAIVTLAILVIGASFAYFAAQGNTSAQTSATVKTYTVDVFSFETGAPISFSLNQDNFASGKGNQTGSTFAKAILTANNKTNTATDHYNLYLNISENTFTYTQDENTPELLLTIKDTSGNEITSITGLTHKTLTDGKGASISGFDITTKSGVITLFDNREITANPAKTEEWNITVTFVNYNADQSANAGKSFRGQILIQKEAKSITMADVCSNGQTLNSCILSMNGKDNTLYYHDSTLANGAGDNSYRYAGASNSVNNYICLGSDTTTCPDANLFRIIGVFGDKTKVIRAKSIGGIQNWDTNGSNTWSTSSLNTYLNGEYLTSLGTLADKIATTTWKVEVAGARNDIYLNDVPKIAYQYEVGSSASSTTVDKKIGLMYVTDYGFAADSSGWTKYLMDYNSNTSKNWLYLGSDEWTILSSRGGTDLAFYVDSTGNVGRSDVTNSNAVRPSFNLLSSTTYVSGSGSMSDPVRIN